MPTFDGGIFLPLGRLNCHQDSRLSEARQEGLDGGHDNVFSKNAWTDLIVSEIDVRKQGT